MFQLMRTRSGEGRVRDKPTDECLRVCLHQLFQTIVPGLSHSDGLLPLSLSVTYSNQAVEGKGMHNRANQKSVARVKDQEPAWGRQQRYAFDQGGWGPQANPSETKRYC